ncbi:MAG TPA: FecR domain-containing protein [Opitutaceae bacterium]|nr:FecR domain-containing protein [Opitutaceae bacterium]
MKAYDQNLRPDESIEALAAAWLVQRDDGFTPEKAAEFQLWRQADPRHEAAVARLEAAWTALQQLQNFRPQAHTHPDADLLQSAARRRPQPALAPILAWSLAAAAALALAAGAWQYSRSPDVEPAQTYTTTSDGYERVTLADGSVAELNANSEIQVRYTSADRQITLRRGEAHFTVAKNKLRPFWVEAGTVAVRAVGTAFDVRREARQIDVLVTEGKVTLARNVNGARPVLARTGGMSPTGLAAGQRAIVAMSGLAAPLIETVTPAEIRDSLAWQGDRLVFVSRPLAEVINEFNRRNQVQIELGDAALGTLPISGSFRPENAEAFVRLLAQGGDVVIERPAEDRIVLRLAR